MKNQSVRFLFSLQLILLQYEKSNVKRNHFIKEGNDVVDLSSSRDYGILLVGSRSQPETTAKGWPKMPGGLIPVLGGIWEEPTPQRYSVTGGEGELVSGDPAGIKILDCSSPLYTMYNEATDRTWHGKMDWFKIGKGVHQGCILSICLFSLYAEYIM